MSLHPAMLKLIQGLAQDAARQDYLAAQAALQAADGAACTNPVPLPDTEQAA